MHDPITDGFIEPFAPFSSDYDISHRIIRRGTAHKVDRPPCLPPLQGPISSRKTEVAHGRRLASCMGHIQSLPMVVMNTGRVRRWDSAIRLEGGSRCGPARIFESLWSQAARKTHTNVRVILEWTAKWGLLCSIPGRNQAVSAISGVSGTIAQLLIGGKPREKSRELVISHGFVVSA